MRRSGACTHEALSRLRLHPVAFNFGLPVIEFPSLLTLRGVYMCGPCLQMEIARFSAFRAPSAERHQCHHPHHLHYYQWHIDTAFRKVFPTIWVTGRVPVGVAVSYHSGEKIKIQNKIKHGKRRLEHVTRGPGDWVGPDRIWLAFAGTVGNSWGSLVVPTLTLTPFRSCLVSTTCCETHCLPAPHTRTSSLRCLAHLLPATALRARTFTSIPINLHPTVAAPHTRVFTTRSFVWGHACVRCVRTIRLPHGRLAP